MNIMWIDRYFLLYRLKPHGMEILAQTHIMQTSTANTYSLQIGGHLVIQAKPGKPNKSK